jgi:hypothetical protein
MRKQYNIQPIEKKIFSSETNNNFFSLTPFHLPIFRTIFVGFNVTVPEEPREP